MEKFGEEFPFYASGASVVRFTNHTEIPPGGTYKFDLSNIGETFQKDEQFQAWRGHIINNALFIEEKIDHIISKILFKNNRENIGSFQSIILAREFFTFMNKWKALRDILNSIFPYKERDYTKLKRDLKEIIDIRNKFAHGQVSYSGNKGEKIILEYFSGEQKKEEISKETLDNFLELIKRVNPELDKIIKEIEDEYLKGLNKSK